MSQRSLSVLPAPDQGKVLLLVDGKLVAELPWQLADKVGNLLKGAARVVENAENPIELIKSQTELIKMGIPVAMSHDPRILKEANHELRNDRDFCNQNSGISVPYKGVVSSPLVEGKPPKEA